MNADESINIIKQNYPPENYTMLREALDYMMEQAAMIREGDARKLERIRSILLGWQETHPLSDVGCELELIDRYDVIATKMEGEA